MVVMTTPPPLLAIAFQKDTPMRCLQLDPIEQILFIELPFSQDISTETLRHFRSAIGGDLEFKGILASTVANNSSPLGMMKMMEKIKQQEA